MDGCAGGFLSFLIKLTIIVHKVMRKKKVVDKKKTTLSFSFTHECGVTNQGVAWAWPQLCDGN